MASTVTKLPTLPPDPRLKAPSHYSRASITAAVEDYYSFLVTLPYIEPSQVQRAPPGGWPSISRETLAGFPGLASKTDEVVELMRRLPYIDGDRPWIAPDALPCDYRLVGRADALTPAATPAWLRGGADEEGWPDWVVQLTAGTDREGQCLMLDTTDGTVTRYQVVGYRYNPSYEETDPCSWRDKADEETRTLEAHLDMWKQKYIDLMFLPVSGSEVPGVFVYPERVASSYEPDRIEQDDVRDIYLEHGWPDQFRREDCKKALQEWWNR